MSEMNSLQWIGQRENTKLSEVLKNPLFAMSTPSLKERRLLAGEPLMLEISQRQQQPQCRDMYQPVERRSDTKEL